MSLVQQIDADIKAALLAKDQASLRGLRAIKSAILLAQTEKGAKTELDREAEIKILQKQIKQRKESIDIYKAQNREDLAKTEREEVLVIEKYLPKSLSPEEIETDLTRLIKESGFNSLKDLGKLMPLATKHFEGKADGKTISEISKKLLS
jgi:uncharacterized protein YqeY